MKVDPPARIPANEVVVRLLVQGHHRKAQAPSGKAVRAHSLVFVMSNFSHCLLGQSRVGARLSVPLSVIGLAVTAAFSMTAVPVLAQSNPSSPALKEVVVTATRTATRADALTSDVVVIEADAIARSGSRTVAELLAREAGVQTSATGGLGKQSSVFVRGTESRHVLLLIDGVRVGSATSGQATFDNLPLESIERIEVLKGPASSLYGSDAVGGVVQIFTWQGQQGLTPHASMTVGSLGHVRLGAGVRGGSDSITYALGVGRVRETGFSATNPGVAFGSHNPDRDGFEQDSLNASMRWKLAPGWQMDALLLHANGRNAYDSGPAPFDVHADVTTQVLGWGLARDWGQGHVTRVKLSRSSDRSTDFGSATAVSRFNTTQAQQSLLHELPTPVGKLLVGVERLEESVDSTQAYAVNRRTTTGVLAGLNGQAQAHSWQASVRRDHNSQFGNATTGLLGYGYQLSPQWRAFGSVGTSFKAPTFNALYWDSPFYKGNPTTQPERGRNREVGVAYSMGAYEAKLTRFDNRVRGFITATPVVTNVPLARMEGWSASAEGAHGDWQWRTHLEALDARNVLTGKALPRRADAQWGAGIDRRLGAWMLGANWLAVGSRFDDSANKLRLPGFGTLDVHARYALSNDWAVQLRVNNLADKTYATAAGYNQPGRGAYVTLNWVPKK